MRPLTVIGMIFLAAVAVDVGLARICPSRWLSADLCSVAGQLSTFASVLVFPSLWMTSGVAARSFPSLLLRAIMAVLISWFLLMECRWHLSDPAANAVAHQRTNEGHDGIGGTAAVFVSGWVFPLIVITILAVGQQSGSAHGDSGVQSSHDERSRLNAP